MSSGERWVALMGGRRGGDAAGLGVRVVVFRGTLFGTFGNGIAFVEMTGSAFGGGGAVLEVGELLDPCREGPSTARAFLTIWHDD